jgi:hypothetical protein
MSRNNGAIGAHTRKLHRTAREIITPEQYEKAVLVLIEIIDDTHTPAKVRLSAIQLLMSYIEGRPTERIEHAIAQGVSIKDLLQDE